jgi:sulfur carrier protein ThiS
MSMKPWTNARSWDGGSVNGIRVKTTIKLYGTLSKPFSEYNHSEGMEMEIPADTKVRDLLSLLKIPESQGAVVAMEGRILKETDPIDEGNVHIFQAMHGG